jgi:hypothetical protein
MLAPPDVKRAQRQVAVVVSILSSEFINYESLLSSSARLPEAL